MNDTQAAPDSVFGTVTSLMQRRNEARTHDYVGRVLPFVLGGDEPRQCSDTRGLLSGIMPGNDGYGDASTYKIADLLRQLRNSSGVAFFEPCNFLCMRIGLMVLNRMVSGPVKAEAILASVTPVVEFLVFEDLQKHDVTTHGVYCVLRRRLLPEMPSP